MLRPVAVADFKAAMRAQRPSVSPEEVQRYEVYDKKFGAKVATRAGGGGGGEGKGNGEDDEGDNGNGENDENNDGDDDDW
mmetsp:Transcript_15091/g.26774  ORF Transcript_15091/g.26774 Transcript_15091/m.26774 type:complete len:80 (+) Transcript_15091:2178-2417(+)